MFPAKVSEQCQRQQYRSGRHWRAVVNVPWVKGSYAMLLPWSRFDLFCRQQQGTLEDCSLVMRGDNGFDGDCSRCIASSNCKT